VVLTLTNKPNNILDILNSGVSLLLFKVTIYCAINGDLPRGSADFNEMPR